MLSISMEIKKLFEEFKNIKYENIHYKTWLQSIKNINETNNNFSVYLKKLKKNINNRKSLILGFYSEEDSEIIININNNEIKQKIYAKELNYPLCNIIFSDIGCYTDINISSSKDIYVVLIALKNIEWIDAQKVDSHNNAKLLVLL